MDVIEREKNVKLLPTDLIIFKDDVPHSQTQYTSLQQELESNLSGGWK